jgi:hypothetical protein
MEGSAASENGAAQSPALNNCAHRATTFNTCVTGTYIRFKLGIQFTRQIHDLLLHELTPNQYTVASVGAM